MDKFYHKFKELFKTKLENFWSVENPQDQIWVIKYKGNIVQLPSKKSAWKKIGHAKSALRNYFSEFSFDAIDYNSQFDYYRDMMDQKERAYQELLNSGDIEFVNVLEKK